VVSSERSALLAPDLGPFLHGGVTAGDGLVETLHCGVDATAPGLSEALRAAGKVHSSPAEPAALQPVGRARSNLPSAR
jgi:hypothetical protein